MLWENGEKSNQAHLSTTPTPTPVPDDDWKTTHKQPWEMNRKFPNREIKIGNDSKTPEKIEKSGKEKAAWNLTFYIHNLKMIP